MPRRFVYVLRNSEIPPRYYTGVTADVVKRRAEHNAGSCIHTAKYRPMGRAMWPRNGVSSTCHWRSVSTVNTSVKQLINNHLSVQ